MDIVRIEEVINGRTYQIEILSVDRDRWRAQIVRRADRATAVMPFYGKTAVEAAGQLTSWLTRATR